MRASTWSSRRGSLDRSPAPLNRRASGATPSPNWSWGRLPRASTSARWPTTTRSTTDTRVWPKRPTRCGPLESGLRAPAATHRRRTRRRLSRSAVTAGWWCSRSAHRRAASRMSGPPPKTARGSASCATSRTPPPIGYSIAWPARRGDMVIASIHWGSNWGYAVPRAQTRFARRPLDGGVALIHGHSSHHVRPIETYRGKLILYGCGDLLTDYGGIGGYEQFRGDLALLYFPTLGNSGELVELRMTPVRTRRFQVTRAPPSEAEWLRQTLGRASAPYGTRLDTCPSGMADTPQLVLRPQ